MVGTVVCSSDNKSLGRVVHVIKGPEDQVQSIQVDVRRVLGLGAEVTIITADKVRTAARDQAPLIRSIGAVELGGRGWRRRAVDRPILGHQFGTRQLRLPTCLDPCLFLGHSAKPRERALHAVMRPVPNRRRAEFIKRRTPEMSCAMTYETSRG